MKFIVSSAALFTRLQTIGRVINSKNTLPILDCFLFDIQDNMLKITASDSETTLMTHAELVESDSNGRFCINAKIIQDSIKEIAEQPLTFDINLDNMEITATYQNGRFNIVGQHAEEYPEITVPQEGMSPLILSAETLLNGINHTFFATADNELRPIMNGIHFDLQADNLTFVSTDGNTLVRDKYYIFPNGNTTISTFTLPKKPANLLKNLLPKEANDVELQFNERNAIIKAESFRLVCRLIEGRYPNYNSVIPQNNPYRVTVDRLSMLSALKRILVFSNKSVSLIRLHFDTNLLIVSGQDIDFSTSAEERLICDYNSSPVNIGFNGTYLINMLNNIEGENVVLELADSGRPGVITPAEQHENEDLLILLMPLKLND